MRPCFVPLCSGIQAGALSASTHSCTSVPAGLTPHKSCSTAHDLCVHAAAGCYKAAPAGRTRRCGAGGPRWPAAGSAATAPASDRAALQHSSALSGVSSGLAGTHGNTSQRAQHNRVACLSAHPRSGRGSSWAAMPPPPPPGRPRRRPACASGRTPPTAPPGTPVALGTHWLP
jgi:hypothetical protein